jgi:hypothetical protein
VTPPTNATRLTPLLATADRLLGTPPTEAAVTWRRGAAFALRAALERAVTDYLAAASPKIAVRSMTAKVISLSSYTDEETARRVRVAWKLLCLGCHYHQYDMGPTEDQLRAWRTEVGVVLGPLTR